MPDGLEEGLTPQDVADLLGYLRDEGGAFVRPSVMVFEDDPAKLLDKLAVAIKTYPLPIHQDGRVKDHKERRG